MSGPRRIAIIGAGVSGLATARLLRDHSAVVFEKSAGVGGRLATRRTPLGAFDHGAQFYVERTSAKPETSFHVLWEKSGASRLWFEKSGEKYFSGNGGMTALAKNLAADLDIRKNVRVSSLRRESSRWLLSFDSVELPTASGLNTENAAGPAGPAGPYDAVVLTAPLPQALDLLDASSIAFPNSLREKKYSCAMVGLFGLAKAGIELSQTLAAGQGYFEPKDGDIFSISDQLSKQNSISAAVSVVMKNDFSQRCFDHEPQAALDAIEAEVSKAFPGTELRRVDYKKWRYCQPLATSRSTELCAAWPDAPGLILAGDAFGGASVNGALRSGAAAAAALTESLKIQY